MLEIAQHKEFANTGFSFSISNEIYDQLLQSNVPISTFNTLFFQSYTNREMAQIFIENLAAIQLEMDLNQLSDYEKLVENIQQKCTQLSIKFEYITTLNYFLKKSFLKAASYLHSTRLDNRLMALSLKNFANYSKK